MKKIHKNRKLREIEAFEKQITPVGRGFSIRRIPFFDKLVKLFLKLTFLEGVGYRNALDVKITEYKCEFSQLPESFDGFSFVFISDLHLDGVLPLGEKVIKKLDETDYDLAILGGDYRYLHEGNSKGSEIAVSKVVNALKERSEIVAILGNHDFYSNGLSLEKSGVKVLANDVHEVKQGDNSIYFAGVDDQSLFESSEVEQTAKMIPVDAFKILLSHSPQTYSQAQKEGFDLQISGHTHGGQICLPGRFPLMKGAPVPRELVYGRWDFGNMQGITTSGIGVSVVAARFFCPPEIVKVTLRRS